MAPKKGCQKVDRISSLPDEILSLILSLLPTKCAVGTSILSNRWKNLWTSITSLHFDFDASPYERSKLVGFTNFVDHVFRNCKLSHIQRFRLHFRLFRANDSHVITWIDEAIKYNVSELDIDVHEFPSSIFSSRTLTVLKFSAGYYGDDTNIPSFCLPCLKVLHICKCEYNWPLKAFMEKIFGSCPVLEDLTLDGVLGYNNEDVFMISAPTLKTLQLQLDSCLYFRYFRRPRKILIKAPKLEYLNLRGTFNKYNIKGDFSTLVKANVNVGDFFIGPRGGSRARDFTLPKFSNLTCLEVISCDQRYWAMLPKLMKGSPRLEVLSLEQLPLVNPNLPDDYTWVEPTYIPKCLRCHLSVIKFEGFKGRKPDLELVKYCLGNGKVLERLTISCQRLTQVEEMQFCAQLLKFSRASNLGRRTSLTHGYFGLIVGRIDVTIYPTFVDIDVAGTMWYGSATTPH